MTATMNDPTVCAVTPLRELPEPAGNSPRYRHMYLEEDDRNRVEAVKTGTKSLERIPRRYRDAAATEAGVRGYAQELVGLADRDPARQDGRPAYISRGRSLLLLGPTGTGKTYQAFGIIRALATSGASYDWRAVTAADLYAEMRPRHRVDSEEVFQEYARTSVLLLDDLGAAKSTEWTEEVTYRIITSRYNDERPTIVTSNLAPRQLEEALGGRVYSRLHEMSATVVLDGKNYRAES